MNLIGHSEGRYLKAYKCPAGIWTIGYGHTSAAGSPEVRPGMTITEDEAVSILQNDLEQYEGYVKRLVKVPLNQHQFDALVSFVFNVGPGNFQKSTLLKLLNRKQYDAVPAQLIRWTRANGKVLKGLVKRRQAEAALWSGVEDPLYTKHDEPLPQTADRPKDNVVVKHGDTVAGGALIAAVWSHAAPLISSPIVSKIAVYGLAGAAVFAVGVLVGKLYFSHLKASKCSTS